MDKLQKLLKRLSPKEREQLEKLLKKLLAGETKNLDIKKLKGTADVYRARTEELRVIFTKQKGSARVQVLDVSRRNEKTYQDF